MRNIAFVLLIFSFTYLTSCETPGSDNSETVVSASSREYYLLKTYTLNSEAQIAVTDAYLQHALLPALKRLGSEQIGVFKDRPLETDSLRHIYVLIPFNSVESLDTYEDQLRGDEAYLQSGRSFLSAAHGNPPFARTSAVVLKAFEDMPKMQLPDLQGPREDRVYELRSYESPTESLYWNKLDMFNAGGEILLFDSLKFNAVFYGDVLAGPKMPNLMYMTSFEDMATRDAYWKLFVDSPQWQKMSTDPQYQNNVSYADIYLLYPTEYSDY